VTPSDNLLRGWPGSPDDGVPRRARVLLAGLFLPGIVGAALLLLLGAALAALTFTTWPVQSPGDPRDPGDHAGAAVRRGAWPRRSDDHALLTIIVIVGHSGGMNAACSPPPLALAVAPARLRRAAARRTAAVAWSPPSIRCSSSASGSAARR
jgi:hypothetical protein